jgi:hypothetical protein
MLQGHGKSDVGRLAWTGTGTATRGAASHVGKVALLTKYQRNGLRPARQPDGQAVTETEGRVVPGMILPAGGHGIGRRRDVRRRRGTA